MCPRGQERPQGLHLCLSRPRTGMLEAKNQGHTRKCFPKKKVFEQKHRKFREKIQEKSLRASQ